MNFQRGRGQEEPEINLIPMIDVLLVIIIFLMLTTTYSKFSGLEINLPTADASKQAEQPNEVDVAVTASGQILVNKSPLTAADVKSISDARRAAGSRPDPIIVINADATATHQSVVDVMQAAQAAGYPHISFATQAPRWCRLAGCSVNGSHNAGFRRRCGFWRRWPGPMRRWLRQTGFGRDPSACQCR